MSTVQSNFHVLQPAVRLMRRLSLPVKMAFIASLIAVPLAILTARTLTDTQSQLSFTRNELAGSTVVSDLIDVAVQTQKHRGQTNLAMSGNDAAEALLPQTREKLKQVLAATDRAMAEHPEWELDKPWRPIHATLTALASGQRDGDRTAVFKTHTQQVNAVRSLVELLGERSSLLFDPEAGSFFLMDLTVVRLLPLTESAALLRGQGAGLIARNNASPDEVAIIFGRMAALADQLESVQGQVAALGRAGEPVPAGFEAMVQKTRAFAELAQQSFRGGQPSGDAAAYFKAGTEAIEAMGGFTQAVSLRLTTLLDERNNRLTRDRNLAFGSALLGLLAVLYFGSGFYLGTMDALHRVNAAARAMSEGDLTVRAEVDGRDEFAEMGREIDTMGEQLSTLVHQIRQTAHTVAATGEQIAASSHDLAGRTSQQAASVEESAATLEQVAQTVRSNAVHVSNVDDLFVTVRTTGEDGSERMRQVVSTIEGIEATSRRVGDIVTVIDGIAFQTNILALNAAVEAARAGESGRGFAVVAAEVRNLAQRSAQASAEIRTLIGASTQQVDKGVGEIRSARDSMGRMIDQVGNVSTAMNQLSTATREQTTAVDQVAEAVRHIGEVTSHNAHSVQEASSTAVSLQQTAQHLSQLVGKLRVRES